MIVPLYRLGKLPNGLVIACNIGGFFFLVRLDVYHHSYNLLIFFWGLSMIKVLFF